MLVLSRRINESVVINNEITVKVLEIRGNRIRLGIVAPPEVPVHRGELVAAFLAEDASRAQDCFETAGAN